MDCNGGNGRDALGDSLTGGDYHYVLEDVPHLTDYLPDLPVVAKICYNASIIELY